MLCAVWAVLLSLGGVAYAQTTAFTYQGKLSDAGSPANGQYDLEFKLFDAANAQVGATLTREDVTVANGSFTVELDFGASPFTTGAAKSLEIGVRPGNSNGAFTTLAPRQQLNSSPYSIQTINAQQLGGVPADQYVKTDDPRLGGAGGNFIQNTTTQQASANFNISGNGIIGGQVGIGTQTPQADVRLDVNGIARFTPGGAGGTIQFGTPNSETGITISGGQGGRADLRFDGSVFKMVAWPAGGVPGNTSGIAVSTAGLVGIGTANPNTGRLNVASAGNEPGIFSVSANRGVWGKSTGSSYGVFGESTQGIGVQGVSTNNVGTTGASTSHVGVYGSTAAGDIAKPGVLGVSTGTGGVGVRGDGAMGVYGQTTILNGIGMTRAAGVVGVGPNVQGGLTGRGVGVKGEGGTGVLGTSTSDTGGTGVQGSSTSGTGVFGTSTSGNGVFGSSTSGTGVEGSSVNGTGVRGISSTGYAVYAFGNAGQSPDKGGFVKAMIEVDNNGSILRCYNGSTGSSTSGCGFSVLLPPGTQGIYRISFGFPVSSRFVSVTAKYASGAPFGRNMGANYRFFETDLEVFTFNVGTTNEDDTIPATFTAIVY